MMEQMRTRNSKGKSGNGKWDPEKALAAAVAERDRFLEQHPEHRAYQQEIDRVLDGAGSGQQRMAVLAMLIEGKMVELAGKMRELNDILVKAAAE
jgi:hypothetical protein